MVFGSNEKIIQANVEPNLYIKSNSSFTKKTCLIAGFLFQIGFFENKPYLTLPEATPPPLRWSKRVKNTDEKTSKTMKIPYVEVTYRKR